MDTERKYPTRPVDGVDVPQMGIRDLIRQLESALQTMEGNRKSYTSPEEIEAGTFMVALFGNSSTTCGFSTRASASSRPRRKRCLKSSSSRPTPSAESAEDEALHMARSGTVRRMSPCGLFVWRKGLGKERPASRTSNRRIGRWGGTSVLCGTRRASMEGSAKGKGGDAPVSPTREGASHAMTVKGSIAVPCGGHVSQASLRRIREKAQV